MKLLLLIVGAAMLTSCASIPKQPKSEIVRTASSQLLRECVENDDAVNQLNIQISQHDVLIMQVLEHRKQNKNNGSQGELYDDAFWDAMLISTKHDLASLMTKRMNLVKDLSILNEQIYNACSNVVFSREMIQEVCTDATLETKRWCATKFF